MPTAERGTSVSCLSGEGRQYRGASEGSRRNESTFPVFTFVAFRKKTKSCRNSCGLCCRDPTLASCS
ncbi:hypothetical protein GN956_G27157 [Arapaima gigas]